MSAPFERPFRDLCPEAEERDSMGEPEFWERALEAEQPAALDPDEIVDAEIVRDPAEFYDGDVCTECGSEGACAYDSEGRALIHAQPVEAEQ